MYTYIHIYTQVINYFFDFMQRNGKRTIHIEFMETIVKSRDIASKKNQDLVMNSFVNIYGEDHHLFYTDAFGIYIYTYLKKM